jgi:hypothetical protein
MMLHIGSSNAQGAGRKEYIVTEELHTLLKGKLFLFQITTDVDTAAIV